MTSSSNTSPVASPFTTPAPRAPRLAIMVIDEGDSTTESGEYLRGVLGALGHELEHIVVKNDAVAIRTALVRLLHDHDLVLTTGGTRITGRNVAIPVVESLLTKPLHGFEQLFRVLAYEHERGRVMLSQAIGGLTRGAMIFALPGNLSAVKIAWEGILQEQLQELIQEMVALRPVLEISSVPTPAAPAVNPTSMVVNPTTTSPSLGRHAGVSAAPSTATAKSSETTHNSTQNNEAPLGRHERRRS